MSIYNCICGFSCENPQKFNGHKRHCKEYLISVGKYEIMQEADKRAVAAARKGLAKAIHTITEKRQVDRLNKWILEQHRCEKCNKIMTEKFGSGRFCSRACANTRIHSDKTKLKIKQTSSISNTSSHQRSLQKQIAYNQNPCFCKICGIKLPYENRFRKTCSDVCHRLALVEAGKSSASKMCKRSQNEIIFCSLCENYFGKEKVLHNAPIFNGWDADIILLDYKIAILWNGPWHYRQIIETQSLAQVQTRDKIKYNEIIAAGFTPYIIKDSNQRSMSNSDIITEFNRLLNYLNL